ncbi:MAG: hypothetical protein FJW23_15860, partial [Acidimicrobiia bacterium]|nr:hypothetical protein [Acidimicrobiia bacterium]
MREPGTLRILGDLFTGRERWLLFWGALVSLVAALFETIGVASVLPFMALVLDPAAAEDLPLARTVMQVAGVTTANGLI